MKKRISKKRILITGLVGLASLLLSSFAVSSMSTSADVEGFSDFSVSIDQTVYNSIFEMPDVTYSTNGQSVKAIGELSYPDGKISTTRKNVLDVAGNYTLTYYAKVDGSIYKETEEFVVEAKNYYTDNMLSDISIGEYNGISGLDCDMVCGDTLSFSPIIDLRNVTKSTQLFELFVIPSAPHTADFLMMDIFLTDIYDENNKLQYCVTPYDLDAAGSYIKVRATSLTQPLTGIYDNGLTIEVNRNNQYGTPLDFGFAPYDNYEKRTLAIGYDVTENKAYCNYHKPLIADLDDYAHFVELWDGFTTGEVRLSIVPKNGTRAHFFMKSALGVNFETIKFEDNEAPVLTVDVDEAEELPLAVVGYPYPIFEAKAFDYFSGYTDVSVNVYRNYYSNVKTNISIQEGEFVPSKEGLYTIEYVATDNFGNSAIMCFDIEAQNTDSHPFSVAVSNQQKSGITGLKTKFGEFSANGGIGDVEYTTEVYYDGKKIDSEKDGFIPVEVGTYTVKVIATDYVSRKAEFTYNVKVDANNKPVLQEVELLKYMTVGREYELPVPQALDYSSGKETLPVGISVVNALGQEKALDGNVYIPEKDDGNSTVLIRYKTEGKQGVTTQDYPVIIRDVRTESGKLNVSQYFYTENVDEINATSTHISYQASNDSFIEFINPLLSGDFSIEFALEEVGDTGTVALYLTNKDDAEQQIVVEIDRNGSMRINGVKYGIEFGVSKAGQKSVAIYYSSITEELTINGVVLRIAKWANGKPYKGFDGNMLWLSFGFSNYGETNAYENLKILSVSGQSFNSNTISDRVRPRILELGEYGGVNEINDTVKILNILYADVLNACEATVSVIAPNGDYVTSLDGTYLRNALYCSDYQFKCSQYGVYGVEITVEDDAGAIKVLDYVVNVFNTSGPQIESESNLYHYLTPGVFQIPSVIVTDESTSRDDIRLYVSLIDKDGLLRSVKVGENITLSIGTYTIQYMAIDLDGNITFFDYTFSVEG